MTLGFAEPFHRQRVTDMIGDATENAEPRECPQERKKSDLQDSTIGVSFAVSKRFNVLY